jgi:hypothetical protein
VTMTDDKKKADAELQLDAGRENQQSAGLSHNATDSMTHALDRAAQFELFHAENPAVYDTLVSLLRNWVANTNRKKVGIAALFERARWEIAITTNDPDFKLNNNYRAYYARLIMKQEEDLAGIFELRRSAADDWQGAA